MAKSPAKRRCRKTTVAEPVGDAVTAEETRQSDAMPSSRKRPRPEGSSPVSPATPRSPSKCTSPPPRCTDGGADANGASKIANAMVDCCCSPKSPRKRLFANSPQKPKWNPEDPRQLRAAKEAFHVSTAPATLVCREGEQMRILEFCKACIEQERAGSLYVCGCPGTGKTLSMGRVKELLTDWTKEVGFRSMDVVSINCTSLTTASEIFSKILEKCCHSRKKINDASSPLQQLQSLFSQKKQSSCIRMILVVVDEMDYLITKGCAVLHDLFMLTTYPFSRFILVGIANAIDLADRFLLRLESLNCKPMVVTFHAYTKDQILRILQQRLMVLGYDVFEPLALEFCARKVAAASGDIRRALGVCISAIEMLETELKCTTSRQKAEIVSFDHMDIALSKAFKSSIVDTIQALPQHQQIVLCASVKLLQCRKHSTTMGDLNRTYSDICKFVQFPAAGMTEFSNMCRVLSDQGLLKLGQSREEKLRRVVLTIDSAEVAFSLKGNRFFRNCLE